jgi:hypothetical protein
MCRTGENAIEGRDGNRIRETTGATLLGRSVSKKYSENLRPDAPNAHNPRLTI